MFKLKLSLKKKKNNLNSYPFHPRDGYCKRFGWTSQFCLWSVARLLNCHSCLRWMFIPFSNFEIQSWKVFIWQLLLEECKMELVILCMFCLTRTSYETFSLYGFFFSRLADSLILCLQHNKLWNKTVRCQRNDLKLRKGLKRNAHT